jgi:hypothetical protein
VTLQFTNYSKFFVVANHSLLAHSPLCFNLFSRVCSLHVCVSCVSLSFSLMMFFHLWSLLSPILWILVASIRSNLQSWIQILKGQSNNVLLLGFFVDPCLFKRSYILAVLTASTDNHVFHNWSHGSMQV